MKELDLRKHALCSLCGKPVGHTHLPLFWTATIERYGIKLDAVRRQDGLAALLGGSSELAQAMGADEEMTQLLMGPVELTLCETCAMENDLVIKAFEVSENG